jgi:hypothetical protein
MTVRINSSFPGGNIAVRSIDGKRIELSPDLRDTTTNWFYWYFEAEFGSPGEYEFHFDMPAIGTRGPAVSLDGGKTWHWGGGKVEEIEAFRYRHDGKAENVRFCTGIPYLQENWQRLHLPVTELCRSRQGRSVELFTHGSGPRKYLFSARHHCCEMAANYVLEGLIDTALNDPRQDFTLFCVPFVDKDGVENGDQGKNRAPHDHARDYGPASIYPEVRAIMELVMREQPEVILDLHCPWLRGGGTNETIYIVGVEPRDGQKRIDRFSAILEPESKTGNGIHYFQRDNIPFGSLWNTSANYTQGKTLGKWACGLPWRPLGASLEIPYANACDQSLTPELWRTFGRALWRAAHQYTAR